MSSEIVPFVEDGSYDTHSANQPRDDTVKGKAVVAQHLIHSNAIGRRPLDPIEEDVPSFDLLGLRSVESYRMNLIGDNHYIRHSLSPEKGPKCTTQLNPTPEFVKSLCEEIKQPLVLHLRGCDQLFSPKALPFPFQKFKTLTSLEITAVNNLTTLPEKAVSEMTQLLALHLSHLPIQKLPTGFFSNLTKLCSLTLTDCPNLHSLPILTQLTSLVYLDLSHLLIETLPDGFFSNLEMLQRVILRGCSKLRSLPSIQSLKKLKMLDLSHCTSLKEMDLEYSGNEWKLDLSYTALHFTSTLLIDTTRVTHLFLRDAKVVNFEGSSIFYALEVLDVSGAQCVKGLDCLKNYCGKLEALDLSRTGCESIDFISDCGHLRYLILKDCTKLQKLPEMENLTSLEVLDISGCEILNGLPEDISSLKNLKELNLCECSGLKELSPGLFDQMSCLMKLDISKTSISHLPSIANLTNLQTLNISQTSIEEVPDSNLISLTEFFFVDCRKLKGVPACLQNLTNPDTTFDLVAPSESGETNFIKDQMSGMEYLHPSNRVEGRISKPNEFYIVSTFLSNSEFDRFEKEFDKMVGILENVASSHTSNQTVKGNYQRLIADLIYIRDNIGLLESCPNCTSAEGLLFNLIPIFNSDSTNLSPLIQTVAKLKLLVPPSAFEEKMNPLSTCQKTERFKWWDGREQEYVSDIDINTTEMQNLSSSYESLTNIQKKCLLHFTLFTSEESIKERKLIYLWYGEGLIDPQHQKDVVSLSNPPPTANHNLIPDPEMMKDTSTKASTPRNDATRVSLQVSTAPTIEEIGRNILIVLQEKGFIQTYKSSGWEPKVWMLQGDSDYPVKFVGEQAMAEGFLNVDQKTRMLTPHLRGSQRACLLASQPEDNLRSSSCKLWADYINSSEKLESFKSIRTLLNVNERIVDIRPEWFFKMRNLTVLHLGICYSETGEDESIEVVDLKFLEELKNMKQLRLLSLEGVSAMTKLPGSVCKLTNLRILNLRECSYLEELPAGIGSLNNLTHLDLTHCTILSMLPKGIRLLSKLEVLKGFVITYQIGGHQHRNACTLRELGMLQKLRILKLVVHKDKFPDGNDLHVFNGMKNLCSLQITWQKNYNNLDQKHQDLVGQKASRESTSRWQTLKCWKPQTHQNDTEELLRSNLHKLELRCFPFENAPNWLHPSGLQKLQKLTVRGGKLPTLVLGDINQNTWSVETLVLKYLCNMDMDWDELMCNFPRLKYLHVHECDHLSSYPFNEFRWRSSLKVLG